jgi:transcriptional regulator of arginine metabolism
VDLTARRCRYRSEARRGNLKSQISNHNEISHPHPVFPGIPLDTASGTEYIFTFIEYLFIPNGSEEVAMDRGKRLTALAQILAAESIGDQETLRRRLGRGGARVSQASLSRDLQTLGAQRLRRVDGTFAYALPRARPSATSAEAFRSRFATSVTGVRRASFLLLLFTPPGEAQLAARLLDEARLPGLLGTVAGDDTILAVAESEKTAKELERKWKEMIP